MPVNYLESCLTAYKSVPEQFRDDLQVSITGKAPYPGKISLKSAQAILAVERKFDLSKKEKVALFQAAKSDKRFNSDSVNKYAAALKRGKNPLETVKPIKTMTFRFMIDEAQYDKLMSKFVEDGPFNSFTALIKAVLRGQKQVSINFLD